jgi:hypothetical protein
VGRPAASTVHTGDGQARAEGELGGHGEIGDRRPKEARQEDLTERIPAGPHADDHHAAGEQEGLSLKDVRRG